MSTNRSQPVVTNQDFGNAQRIENLPNAVDPQHPLTLAQALELLGLKQDNLTGGSGVSLDGTTVNVDLAVSGTDYGTLVLSGTNYASLNGTYTLAPFKGSLSYSGTSLDLDVGGNYNVYYKDNGGGVWAVVAKRDTDNIHNNQSVGESNGSWIAVLTSVDPTSIDADYNNFIPNYQAVDFSFITYSSEQDDLGNGTVSSAASEVTYASGNTPAGLIFENDKLAIDFAENIGDAESTNVLPASVAVTAINEAEARASQAQNTTFSNAIAQLAGNPGKVQSALEAVKALIDSVSNTVSNNQSTAATEYGHIDALQQALGSAVQNMGVTHESLSNDATAKELLNELATLVAALRADTVATFGIDAGTQVTPTGDNVSVGVTIMQAINQLDEAIGAIQGDLTSRLPAVDHYHSGLQYPLTADQLAGTEAVDEVKYDVVDPETDAVLMHWSTDLSSCTTPKTLLVDYGVAGHVGAGVYVRDPATGFLSRVTWLDEDSEIQRNAIMQIRYGGAIAGAEFAISSPDDTIVGAEPIGFNNIRAVIVGQSTIDTSKLSPELNQEIDLKTDKFVDTVTTDASGYVIVTHDLATADFVAQVWTTTGVVELVTAEISNPTSTQVVIGAAPSTTYKVVIIG